MATEHRRTGSGTRKRGRGKIDRSASTPGQPPSSSESTFSYGNASAHYSPTGPSTGARLILGADSGDTPEESLVRSWIGEAGVQGRLQVLTAPDGGDRLRRFLRDLLLDDDDGDMLTDDHDQDLPFDVDDGCTGVREPLPRPLPSGTWAACVDPEEVVELVH